MTEKKEVQKVDVLTAEKGKIFNLTKEEALERLKAEKITHSEQMLTKWCRDGDINAVRVVKGAVNERGLHISEISLEAFILKKTNNVESLLVKYMQLKEENKKLESEIKTLKESGIRKPREKKIILKNPFTVLDELHFEYNRAKHKAVFTDGALVSVLKNSRTGFQDITENLEEEVKEAIIQTFTEKSNS